MALAELGRLACRRLPSRHPTASVLTVIRHRSSDTDFEFDLAVIGGGSGGLSCAREAASLGAKVAVLDFVSPSPLGSKWGLGGTCVNVGCIPKKLFHHASLLGEHISDARAYGWQLPNDVPHDWTTLREAVQNHIKSVNWVTRVALRDSQVHYVNGRGRFISPHEIAAAMASGEQRNLKAARILVAVGARPRYPNFPGSEFCVTSDDLFSLQNHPGRTLIIGAGYIGLECAGFLRGLGSEVSVLVRSEPLRGFDRQMSSMVVADMERRGTEFLHKCVPVSIAKQSDGRLLARWARGSEEGAGLFDTVLVATGRRALTAELDVKMAGLEPHAESGKLQTLNEQTSVEHIFAVGDVLQGKPELTPVAAQAGQLLARRLFGGGTATMSYDLVPTAVFTPLEYACVGLSEEAAVTARGEDALEVFHAFYKPTEFSVPQRDTASCYLKVVCLRDTPRTVLGLHFVGPGAGEVVQGFAAAMRCGLTVDQLRDTVGIHPTVAEEFTRVTVTKRSGLDPAPQACCS